jgi:hypothetical protein
MTKSPNKIVLRRETLRVLSNKELTLAIGGLDSDVLQAYSGGDKGCPLVVQAK